MGFDKGTYLTFGLAVVCILLTLVAIGAHAEDRPQSEAVVSEVSANAADPARDLITQQLDAIRERDAERVWSLTTENFHAKFDTGKDFLAQLRLRLRPIYNHKGYRFLSQSGTQGNLIQKVEMEDRYGDPVTVIYRIEQQDGRWLIDSFAVLPRDAEPI